MHDDRQPSRHRDERALHATMPGNLHAPGLEPRPLAAVGHQDQAASNNISRIMASPHFEMPPIRSISPDCCRRGVRPKAAPTDFELVKREGTSTVARKVSATTGPTPGVVIRLPDAGLKLHLPNHANLETEVAQSAAQVILDCDRL